MRNILSKRVSGSTVVAVSAAAAAFAGGGDVVTAAAEALVASNPNANLWFISLIAGLRAVAQVYFSGRR